MVSVSSRASAATSRQTSMPATWAALPAIVSDIHAGGSSPSSSGSAGAAPVERTCTRNDVPESSLL